MTELLPGTRVRLLPSLVNDNFARHTGFDPTGKLGTVQKHFLYYFVKLDDEIPPTEGVRDNVLCLLPDEIEVLP